MFSFFGLFADPIDGLQEQLTTRWPGANMARIEKPFAAIGLRFGEEFYQPADEDIPAPLSREVDRLSAQNPGARFLLLRTECSGGTCANWGHVIEGGNTVCRASGEGALRRLVSCFGIDLGDDEVFEPLRRTFSWHR